MIPKHTGQYKLLMDDQGNSNITDHTGIGSEPREQYQPVAGVVPEEVSG